MNTVLCVPGHQEAMLVRARERGAGLLLFDLEDAVPEAQKDRARELVVAHATPADAVRVNGGPRLRADLAAVRETGAAVWLPKASDPAQVAAAALDLGRDLVALVELPRLLVQLAALSVVPFVAGLAFGAADFAAAARVPLQGPMVEHARLQVALAAAAMGVPAYDSPCVRLERELVLAEALRARELGYGFKGCIHPRQLKWMRELDALEAAERRHAEVLLAAYNPEREAVALVGDQVLAPPIAAALRGRSS